MRKIHNPKLKFYIGDVRDSHSVETAMREVDYVFHAMLKASTFLRILPNGSCKTNIIGTENVLQNAIRNNVKK